MSSEKYSEPMISADGIKTWKDENARAELLRKSQWQDCGGSAFPHPICDGAANWMGMTLRDYFAADANEEDIAEFMDYVDSTQDVKTMRVRARYAYADAMLAERAKKGGAS